MTSSLGSALVGATCLLLSSALAPSALAETWEPRTLDCASFDQEGAAGQRIMLAAFSLTLPSAPNLCIQGRDETSVWLSTNALMGKKLMEPPSPQEMKHSLAMHASLKSTTGQPVRTAADLRAVAEGIAAAPEGFSVHRSTLTPVKRGGVDCISIASLQEDLENPLSPSGAFMLEVPEELVCLYPGQPDVVVTIGYSERYPKGYEPPRLLAEALKPQLDAFMRSLAFDSTP
jgi:hypothetical protein